MLKILNASTKVSEYTDDVDNQSSFGRGANRRDQIIRAIAELFITITGLSHTANNLPANLLQTLSCDDCKISDLECVVAPAFEIGRRFKRVNPDKMRSEYGKLVMLLQDATQETIQNQLEFDQIVLPAKTVKKLLADVGAEALLNDNRLSIATDPVPPRASAERIQAKGQARDELLKQYGGDARKEEAVDHCLKSIDDAVSFIHINLQPMKKLKHWLDLYFTEEQPGWSLAIRNGKNGACLTHNHRQQRHYVKEAITLWEVIHSDIFDFWEAVEKDMLTGNPYRYRNTGQGFHRVSTGPTTFNLMSNAISRAQQIMGGWVGSTVVHLGDDDVPNPLVFIDKYTIIPRLLHPVVQCIEALDEHFDESKSEQYPGIRTLLLNSAHAKSHEELKMMILSDFYRHAFDGSGDDGGSCIDGRLTSAWNWCSELHKKKFYNVFLLTGFVGFDANYS